MKEDAIIRQLSAEDRRLNQQYERLKKTIIEESGDPKIATETADLPTLIALVKDLGLRARQYDEEIKRELE